MSEENQLGQNVSDKEKIKGFIFQIVQTEREKQASADDIKEYYTAAKEAGFNTKALRKAVKLYMMTPSDRRALNELDDVVDMYLQATGVLD